MTSFAEERYHDVIGEVRPLLQRHWEEIARNKDTIKLAPDDHRYAKADERGQLLIVTARRNGTLVGYLVFLTAPGHLHYATTPFAESDIFWVAPEERRNGVGAGLFVFAEDRLRERGVIVVHTRVKNAHPEAGVLLSHLGHEAIETVYAKALR